MKRILCILAAGAILVPVPTSGESTETIIVEPVVWQGYRKFGPTTVVFVPFHHVKLGVDFEDRVTTEYVLPTPLGPVAAVTFFYSVNNFDDGGELGILDYYEFPGNGQPDLDDFWAGNVPYISTLHDESPNPWGLHFVDTTDVYFAGVAAKWQRLGIRVSTKTSDLFVFNWAMEIPDPVLVFEFRTFELADHAMFLECLTGPDQSMTEDCAIYDFDRDLDIDMADFRLFQIGFDAWLLPPFTMDCCDSYHGPGCENPDDEDWPSTLQWFCSKVPECCDVDWDVICVFLAEAVGLIDCPED